MIALVVIPIHDLNPGRRLPLVNWTLILLNFFVFFFGASLSRTGCRTAPRRPANRTRSSSTMRPSRRN